MTARKQQGAAGQLRYGWTTGACATAATKAALAGLWTGQIPESVTIRLPGGQTPEFQISESKTGDSWAEAGVVKDAGDDPDVTHGALVVSRVRGLGPGVSFQRGEGVGLVTRPGLPVAVGEPAINPVPRRMMEEAVREEARRLSRNPGVEITLSIPGGEEMALRTWNPRLGIEGGLSILGTTGIVKPYSCSAWIASIHRGIDVARESGLSHVAGCAGSTSERAVQRLCGLPDHAMLDMGDFAGGMLKYLKRRPIPKLTIGGGMGKMTKLAQGAMDLHSGRSQIDFSRLGAMAAGCGLPDVSECNTSLEAIERAGPALAQPVARDARKAAMDFLGGAPIQVEVIVVGRDGSTLARSS